MYTVKQLLTESFRAVEIRSQQMLHQKCGDSFHNKHRQQRRKYIFMLDTYIYNCIGKFSFIY